MKNSLIIVNLPFLMTGIIDMQNCISQIEMPYPKNFLIKLFF